jgi:hypothetical protein
MQSATNGSGNAGHSVTECAFLILLTWHTQLGFTVIYILENMESTSQYEHNYKEKDDDY